MSQRGCVHLLIEDRMASSPAPPSQRVPRGNANPLLGSKAMRAPRLAEQLYTQIYKQIEAGQYPVNSKLPSEAELCEVFGVSRPVVREALSRLHTDGVVETQRGAGSFVRLRRDAELFRLAPIGGLLKLRGGPFFPVPRLAAMNT